MADKESEIGPSDAKRIHVSQAGDIEYWTKEFGCTVGELRFAVQEVGPSVAAVTAYLHSHRPRPL